MKYVLAISGGVDSVVLLDMVARQILQASTLQGLQASSLQDLLVAHFDHGIRAESGRDAALVERLARKYQVKFVLGRGELGENTNEDEARQARYEFLRKTALSLRAQRSNPDPKTGLLRLKPRNDDQAAGLKPAVIITAHHQDDLIETIVMNILRGTGWRGLAPMWADDIERPLLNKTKAELVAYAIKHQLEWAEDETNYSPRYFRNRLRDVVYRLRPDQRQSLLKLYAKQKTTRTEIEKILQHISDFTRTVLVKEEIAELPSEISLEILSQTTSGRLTTPQLKRLLDKLQTAKSGDLIQPGGGLQIGIYQGEITVSNLMH
jgi:tRNA(Ile)-lysidine synthetase-like protein